MPALLRQTLTFRSVPLQFHSEDFELPPSNYRKHLKKAYSFHEVMSASVQELPVKGHRATPSQSSKGSEKSTGFPEPFNTDRNTTLRHPDADISENATIEARDIDMVRTRSRHSFFHGKNSHKGRISSGKIGMDSDSSLEDMSVKAVGNPVDPVAENEGLNRMADHVDEHESKDQGKKKGLLRKLNFH